MTLNEILAMKFALVEISVGVAITLMFGYLIIKHFLTSYLNEKGKNLATSEDIERITTKVEGIRTQYSSLVEELKARHQLRLAALDQRLKVHQDAFSMWCKLFDATHTKEVGKVVLECQYWWEQNCIYLEPKVRKSFVEAYSAANNHNSLLSSHADAALVKSNWNLITKFPNELFEAIQLPALSELESRILIKQNSEQLV